MAAGSGWLSAASQSPSTAPWSPVTGANADQARLGFAGSRKDKAPAPPATGTCSVGAGASGRPERTAAECPYQHARERGTGSRLTPGLVLREPCGIRTRKYSSLHRAGRSEWPQAHSPVLGLQFPSPVCLVSPHPGCWVTCRSRPVSPQEAQLLPLRKSQAFAPWTPAAPPSPRFAPESHPGLKEDLGSGKGERRGIGPAFSFAAFLRHIDSCVAAGQGQNWLRPDLG